MKNILKKRLAFIASIMLVLSAAGCSNTNINSDSAVSTVSSSDTGSTSSDSASPISIIKTDFDAEDLEVGYDESSAVTIKLNGTSAEISGKGAKETDGVITISEAGTYVVSGELTNGRIIVDADKDAKIRIVLDGAKITCSDNAPIFINKADKVFVTLSEGSENSLTDGSTYDLGEDDSNVDGAIFSRADLTLNGSGKLTITANYKHGIVGKDDLVITGGTYNITAASGGIYGKDSVRIKDGDFTVDAGSNAIKATNDEESDKGYVYIKDGTFKLTAENDGIEAATAMLIDGGDIDVTTGGGSSNASIKSNGQPNENWGSWGGGRMNANMGQNNGSAQSLNQDNGNMPTPPDFEGNDGQKMTPPANEDGNANGEMPQIPQGNGNTNASGEMPQMPQSGDNNGQMTPPDMPSDNNDKTSNSTTSSSDSNLGTTSDAASTSGESDSAKGLKADGDLMIRGGSIKVDSSDDAVHSNGSITYAGGELNLSSGDDGTHADGDLLITDGNITVAKSYEGLEGVTVTIEGGEITVTASDDGINAGGGSDTGSENRMGRDSFNQDTSKYLLTFKGGVTTVNASGDGIDSNGNLVVEGGEIYISGPTNNGNGSIDYGDGATSWITGGTIVACGSTGMAESFGEQNSTQYSVLHNLSSTVSGGTEVKVTDSDGNVVVSFTPEKDYQSVVFSTAGLKEGTYTITAGDITEDVEVSSIVTSNGNSGGMGMRGNMGAGGMAKGQNFNQSTNA